MGSGSSDCVVDGRAVGLGRVAGAVLGNARVVLVDAGDRLADVGVMLADVVGSGRIIFGKLEG